MGQQAPEILPFLPPVTLAVVTVNYDMGLGDLNYGPLACITNPLTH